MTECGCKVPKPENMSAENKPNSVIPKWDSHAQNYCKSLSREFPYHKSGTRASTFSTIMAQILLQEGF